ncbi:MAG: hypothetical protein IJF92_06345 [Bacilli bacterium]|nr:hypothetical protein [Bacilli bacterium]
MKLKETIKNNKLTILFILFIISICLLLTTYSFDGYDYFWHIKAGEYMVKSKQIITKDIFSWIVNGKYWMSHEWLFEIIIYSFKIVFGSMHKYIFIFINSIILSMLFFIPNKKEYLKNITFSILWISIMMIFIIFMQVRPHVISYIFIATTIYVLYDLYNNEDSKKIYILPFISVLWANIHGGCSNLIYIFCTIFIICGLCKFNGSKIEYKRINKKQLKKYIIVCILSILAIMINPHGIKMILYPYTNMMDTTMLNTISEWRPTNLSSPSHIVYFFIVVLIVIIYLFSKKKIRFIDLILLSISIFLGFKSIRFWPYIYIISTYNIFYYIKERKLDKGTNICLVILIIIILYVVSSNLNQVTKGINKGIVDNKAISYLKKEKPKRLYNYYDYGGYLVYKDIKVFVDGRADLYSKYNYKDYYDISVLNKNYNKLIKKYKFDYFIIPKSIGLNTYLYENSNYKLEYTDKKTVIYKYIGNNY